VLVLDYTSQFDAARLGQRLQISDSLLTAIG
jgi:hypothetical protein